MRDGLPLSAEARRVLRASRTVLVGTVSARGRPFLTPVYFVWVGSDVYVTTGPASWTGRNVRATGRATLVFGGEGGSDDVRLEVRGPARCVDGWHPPLVLVLLALRYYLAPGALLDALRHRRQLGLRQRYHAATTQMGYVVVRAAQVQLMRAP